LADLGKYFQNLNFWKIQLSQFFQFYCNYAYRIYCQIHVKACFWRYLDPSDASISLFWPSQVVLFPVWTHAIDTLQTEIPKYKIITLFIATIENVESYKKW
jgi:hypothetical protein